MTTPDRPQTLDDQTQWRTAGDRIQALLDSFAAGGMAAQERARELVREVVGLYGAGLHRIIEALDDPVLAERLATDDLVASLLLVHGLHPHGVQRRVSDALDRVRPYLGSHGGDVDLIGVTDDSVRLAFQGSCKSCPSSAATLELAVEDAIRAAAPEISSIEVVVAGDAPQSLTPGLIPAESLLSQVHSNPWHAIPGLADLRPGEVAGFEVAAATLLACRIDGQLFAYRDRCPVCDDTLAGSELDGALLRCPRCGSAFDVVHAGAGADGTHLDPLPLLDREGVPSVALPTPAPAAVTVVRA